MRGGRGAARGRAGVSSPESSPASPAAHKGPAGRGRHPYGSSRSTATGCRLFLSCFLLLFSPRDERAMDARCLRVSSLLLFLGYLLQAVLGTTVIPLCGPGEMENCTTALIQTENSPRVAQVGITRCKPEMKDYCFHGQCVYIVDLDEHYCRCDVGFSGVRCVHSELVRQPLSKEYVALTVIVVLLFLIAISIASYYICRRYRNKKRQMNTSEYKEVGTL
ncbi:proepiregulin [Neopsephotus bourkii]|uniref:proepiregulin n=1 Tax=Neopsephotus bourkii TaxID=309878 RepID=UPI002AA53B14|nr:proepiregulin [Neopsephotus bourkii]